MIEGFEEETCELSDSEIDLAKQIAKAFIARGEGPDTAISSTQIIRLMAQRGFKITGPRLRKMIQYIRTKQLVKWLVSPTNTGYFISKDPAIIKAYTDSMLKRENSMKSTRLSFPQFNKEKQYV